jgi:hypothetical protein
MPCDLHFADNSFCCIYLFFLIPNETNITNISGPELPLHIANFNENKNSTSVKLLLSGTPIHDTDPFRDQATMKKMNEEVATSCFIVVFDGKICGGDNQCVAFFIKIFLPLFHID